MDRKDYLVPGGGTKKSTTPKLAPVRKARALAMLDRKIHGDSNQEIGRNFQCDPQTVTATLKWAVKQGLVQNAEDKLYNQLLGLSMTAYENALQEGDIGVATKVLETLGVIRKAKEQKMDTRSDDEWQRYLIKRSDGAKRVRAEVIDASFTVTETGSKESGGQRPEPSDQEATVENRGDVASESQSVESETPEGMGASTGER